MGMKWGGGAKHTSRSSRGVLSTFISVRSPRELEQVALAVIPHHHHHRLHTFLSSYFFVLATHIALLPFMNDCSQWASRSESSSFTLHILTIFLTILSILPSIISFPWCQFIRKQHDCLKQRQSHASPTRSLGISRSTYSAFFHVQPVTCTHLCTHFCFKGQADPSAGEDQ